MKDGKVSFRVEKAGAQESGAKGLGENMKKEKILKEDGRYLIFYTFGDEIKGSKERAALSGFDSTAEEHTSHEDEDVQGMRDIS